MKKIIPIIVVVFTLVISSCSQKEESKGVTSELPMSEPPTESSTSREKTIDKTETQIERKVIKEGEINFETSNILKTKTLIAKTVQELNGYISKDNVNDYSDKIEHRLIIRVASEKFDPLLNKISESADKIDNKNIEVLDVTEEYIDIEARIKTKKELQNRYKELLVKAVKVEEILSIEKEIGQLQTEIESVEGRMKYLKDRISFSTLTVIFYQKTAAAFRFTNKFGEALKSGWSAFLWLLIGMTHLWTFIIIGGAIGTYFFIKQKRKKNV